MTRTGACFWRDDLGQLWLAQSFVDAAGVVVTTHTPVEAVEA